MTTNDYVNHSNTTAAKSATFVSGLPDLNNSRRHVDKLPILISCRVRLDEAQRHTLKLAWQQLRAESQPAPNTMPGSSIKAYGVAQAEAALKTSSLIISDLISSRESVQLQTVFELEKLFDIELITQEQFMEACQSYWTFNKAKANG